MVKTRIRIIRTKYRVYPERENIATDTVSQLPNNGNQYTTRDSTYTTENMSELYNIDKLTYGTFPLSFKIIDKYQR